MQQDAGARPTNDRAVRVRVGHNAKMCDEYNRVLGRYYWTLIILCSLGLWYVLDLQFPDVVRDVIAAQKGGP